MRSAPPILAMFALFALACDEGAVVVEPARVVSASGGAGGAAETTAGAAGRATSAGRGGEAGAAGTGGAAGAVAVKRTVETRSPYGNLNAGNLLWDGDLEWSGPWVSQYSWATTSMSPGFGGGAIEARVGAACRSGLKCAALGQAGLAAIGVAPATPLTHARGWVRVPAGVACGDVVVHVDGCFLDATGAAPLPAASPAPDAAGWCRFEGDRPTPDDAVCLYFQRPAGISGDFVVDDAFVGASAATKTLAAVAPPSAAAVAEIRARQEALRARVHRLPPPMKPPRAR
ncbi:MAG: hypothetical protein IT374_13635 [Polyangiaceae bacterium]|nr:hypothetical protein [Polyangiaceae bacterium]